MSEEKQKHILFVDDEKDLIDIYSSLFKRNGYKMTGAASGKEAIDYLRKYPGEVDLVITDFQMPGGNGYVLANHVNNMKKEERPKIFLLSGYTNVDIEEKGWTLGFELLRKPIASKKLIEKVNEYLGGGEKAAEEEKSS